ncbi:MAG: Methyltransferase type 11 [Candidatus Woesebacteria bacterium GW2011_GWB1_45_5]|uniref:Methyltransferase type 11 n=1 Tax=Candidatus Woesebacteria bacterium GW2011_GWB1_45_5 TaxID=1618581 RepID=A0A0G1MQT1_9BACT|nr:MAG: Methyltransferase type 11 [Candidatus Woesebacteria bacterium GW2011_GWB1_45_5]
MNYHRDRDYLKNESMFRNIFRKRLNLLKSHLSGIRQGRVLDIGCSNGVFLDLFKGWETWGVEPSGSGETAKKKGHKIIKNYFEKADLPKNYFDLVIMNHTLEHLDNLVEVLRKARSLLKKGGIILIDVPNAGGIGAKLLGKNWPYLLPEEHKHQFTKESLLEVLKDSGFKILDFSSRSGIFEYANPLLELPRKRFLLDLAAIPYSAIATLLNMGDSMSIIGKKTQ